MIEISLHLDGNTQPIRPLKPNYAGRQYIQAFMSLFSGTGKENRDEGTVRVELKFGAALPNTVTVVANAEFENVIEIDRNRNVIYGFGS